VTPRKPRRRVSPHARLLKAARPHYQQLLEQQGGVCAICGRPPVNRRLDIDHCHKQLVIRGLLCHLCNRQLGNRVTADWMRKAISYLEQPPIRLPEEDT
jgi:hypothetical protein